MADGVVAFEPPLPLGGALEIRALGPAGELLARLHAHPRAAVLEQREAVAALRLRHHRRARIRLGADADARRQHGQRLADLRFLRLVLACLEDDHRQQREEDQREQDDDGEAAAVARAGVGHCFISEYRIVFWTCSRFSASSKITDCGPSITSAATSSPRCAGKQCMKIASRFACDINRPSTIHPWKSRLRCSASSSCPIEAQTSVSTMSASFTASSMEVVISIFVPAAFASWPACATIVGSGA